MTEHEAMIACQCSEADRLTAICLACGRIHLPCPSLVVLAAATVYGAAQAIRWVL